MNELQIFNNEEFGNIRTVTIDNEPWFVGKDVATSLGYERATKAIQDHVDSEDKDEIPIQDSIGRMQMGASLSHISLLESKERSSQRSTSNDFTRWKTS